MQTLSSSTMNTLAAGAQGYEMFITAHPLYSQNDNPFDSSVDSYNVAVELGLNGPKVNLVKENSEGERTVVSSFASDDGIPYLHSFGLSKNYATIVLQSVRLDVAPDKMIELGFLRSMEHVDHTRVVLVELSTGEVVLDKTIDEKVYFYHSVSQAEATSDDDDAVVSLRLCAYDTPDQLTGEHQFMRLEQARKGRDMRNKLHEGGKFCDVVCNVKDQTVRMEWNDQIKQGFELPVTRYSRTYDGELPASANTSEQQAHPRYIYAFGAYALDSPDYDNWGLFKFDLQENRIDSCYQQDSVYLSEPMFVSDPNGKREDDGVLLTQAYFGRERETKLLVIDATTMKVVAEAPTGNRAPLDFHGAWIPSLNNQGTSGMPLL
jgi:carotenoid cleavage dioxygenase-like enzyme